MASRSRRPRTSRSRTATSPRARPTRDALGGEPVLVARWVLFVPALLHHPSATRRSSRAESTARGMPRLRWNCRSGHTGERVAQHERRPPVADQVGDAGDRARPLVEAGTAHCQATASSRARTCLCQGVPASQSRSALIVSSFGGDAIHDVVGGRRARARWAGSRARAHRIGELDRGNDARGARRRLEPSPVVDADCASVVGMDT